MATSQTKQMEATPYRISTMTITGNINSIIDLDTFYANLDIMEVNCDACGVVYAEYGNNKHDRISKGTHVRKNAVRKHTKKAESTKRFDNSVTLLLRISMGNEINVKLFKNGKVQMTGVKTENDGHRVLQHVTDLVTRVHNNVCDKEGTNNSMVKDIDTLRPSDLSIHLINSDFKVNMEIRRDLLYRLLIEDYSVICTYEPCIYPGVKIQYYLNRNSNNTHSIHKPGQCTCVDGVCNGKGDGFTTTNCKKITISVFQSGCVLITGVTRKEHIDIGYDFIVGVLKRHEQRVKRVRLALT